MSPDSGQRGADWDRGAVGLVGAPVGGHPSTRSLSKHDFTLTRVVKRNLTLYMPTV